MFNKFRNKIPEVGLVLAIILFVTLSPLLLVLGLFLGLMRSGKYDQQWEDKDYNAWLAKHEGDEFFCYTNRNKSVVEVEKYILPVIGDSVYVVKLVGKDPHTELDQEFVSHALNNLNNVGFPNVMKIIGGRMHDISIRKPTYNAINQGKSSCLPSLYLEALSTIRSKKT